jgi:hypothetical protein
MFERRNLLRSNFYQQPSGRMKMKCVMACVVLSIGLFAGTAMANEYVRNGMPCLNGICVGDDISTLSHIKWNPAKKWVFPINKQNLQTIEESFVPEARAAAEEVYSYLMNATSDDTFDNALIPKLSKIKGFCKQQRVRGSFTSASGFRTTVLVEVIAESPDKQAWKVTHIFRKYPAESYTSAQQKELREQFKANYSSVKKPAYWAFGSGTLELAGSFNISETIDFLKQYPGCGKAVSID